MKIINNLLNRIGYIPKKEVVEAINRRLAPGWELAHKYIIEEIEAFPNYKLK